MPTTKKANDLAAGDVIIFRPADRERGAPERATVVTTFRPTPPSVYARWRTDDGRQGVAPYMLGETVTTEN